ncbi:MAG: anti-sigma B factor antagonist [Planctomycetota bacterium]|jgi:anti-sigma B factor antagonist
MEFECPDQSVIDLCHQRRTGPGGDQLVAVFTSDHVYTSGSELHAARADWYFPKPVCLECMLAKFDELFGERVLAETVGPSSANHPRLAEQLDRLTRLAGIEALQVCLEDEQAFTWLPTRAKQQFPETGRATASAVPFIRLDSRLCEGNQDWSLYARVVDAANSAEFCTLMAPVIEEATKLVIQLDELNFIDSSGLSAILTCLRQTTEKDGNLKLSGLTLPVRAVFELVRMHRVSDIHNTIEGALLAFHD